jgi:hypothetical protein
MSVVGRADRTGWAWSAASLKNAEYSIEPSSRAADPLERGLVDRRDVERRRGRRRSG